MKFWHLSMAFLIFAILSGAGCGGGDTGVEAKKLSTPNSRLSLYPSIVTVTPGTTVRFQVYEHTTSTFGGDSCRIYQKPETLNWSIDRAITDSPQISAEAHTISFVAPVAEGLYTIEATSESDQASVLKAKLEVTTSSIFPGIEFPCY